MLIQLGTIALIGTRFGVALRKLSLGSGKILLRWRFLELRLLPLSGSVNFKDSRVDLHDDLNQGDAFDLLAPWRQSVVAFSGLVSLLFVSLFVLGETGWIAFLNGFTQLFAGALSPFDEAQISIKATDEFMREHGAFALLGLVCAKMAMFNVLPFYYSNSWLAFSAWCKPSSNQPGKIAQFSLLLLMGVILSWGLAFTYYLYQFV